MTKYEYEIECVEDQLNKANVGAWVNMADNKIHISQYPDAKIVTTRILNKRGQEGWIYSGTDPMGNMVFRREIMES